MYVNFKPVALVHTLPPGTSFCQPRQVMPPRIHAQDPALSVMTDLRQVVAVTIGADASIDEALEMMIRSRVRLLLVVDLDKAVQGLITATDLQGEAPLRFMHQYGMTRKQVMVRDIMTPLIAIDALHIDDVQRVQVGDIIATLQQVGRHHALVVDRADTDDQPVIRGIFSLSQIARQLDVPVDIPVAAVTFAELEAVLNHERA
jgi:CBS domain-containing protein